MTMNLDDILQQMDTQGFCVIPSVIAGEELKKARGALELALAEMARRGIPTYDPLLDPNAANVRVYNLPDLSPVFMEMLRHPKVLPVVRALITDDAVVSNFTGNIAFPGSQSMKIHSDHALVMPPPWLERWGLNMIWCLDDVHDANGATRYLPKSHLVRDFEELPADTEAKMLPFAAKAGDVIAVDSRLWHTSGSNRTKDERRALLFAYYSRGFIRQQANWEAALSQPTKATLDQEMKDLLGMGPLANAALGIDLVARDRTSRLINLYTR
jgi:hypothetical protein